MRVALAVLVGSSIAAPRGAQTTDLLDVSQGASAPEPTMEPSPGDLAGGTADANNAGGGDGSTPTPADGAPPSYTALGVMVEAEIGTVLDPFAGSGTTGLVAQRLSRRAVLIDLNADYIGQVMDRNRDIPLGLGA